MSVRILSVTCLTVFAKVMLPISPENVEPLLFVKTGKADAKMKPFVVLGMTCHAINAGLEQFHMKPFQQYLETEFHCIIVEDKCKGCSSIGDEADGIE